MKNVMHILGVLLLISTLGGFFPGEPASAGPTVTFTVDTLTDVSDSDLGDGICDSGDGCSLRAAIEQADSVSSAGNPLTIHFDSDIAGATLTLSLGPIAWTADYVTLDGESNGMTISGSGLASGQSIFTISGSHNTITQLTIRNSPQDAVQMGDFAGTGDGNDNTVSLSTLVGNASAGVYIHGGVGNRALTNLVGLTSVIASGCIAEESNIGDGIILDSGALSTTIEANYIGCSMSNGIYISGLSGAPRGTYVHNNFIGLNLTGATPNFNAGILDQEALNTTLSGNVISGNGNAGVWLLAANGVTLINNRIGVNSSGVSAVPNGYDGVAITDAATNITVGGSTSIAERNVISGNTYCGVRIRDGSTNILVDFNLIGLSANGLAAIPNLQAGVCIFNSHDNVIGTSAASAAQFISGNGLQGIYIEDSSGNRIGQSNRIGVASDGVTPRGNGLQGIFLDGASNTFVAPEIVSYNGAAGVAVAEDVAQGNLIRVAHIRGNGGLPIDIGNDGPTPNGTFPPPGPNNWLEYPVITSASGSPVTLEGTVCAACKVLVYRAIGNPADNGSGGDYMTEVTADGSGNWSVTLPYGLTRNDVTLVAQNPLTTFTGDTSEMSPAQGYRVYLPVVKK